MRHWESIHVAYSTVLPFIGLVIFSIFLNKYKENDAISVYSLERAMPAPDRLFVDSAGQTPGQKALNAQINMIEDCLFPGVYNLITGAQALSTPAQTLAASGMSSMDSSMFQSKWQMINLDAWNTAHSAAALPCNDINDQSSKVAKSPTHFSPVCRCMHSVFSAYVQKAKPNFNDAQAALRACLATRPQIPRQTLLYQSDLNDVSIPARKILSRTSYVLLIGLAIVGNLLYRNVDPYHPFANWNVAMNVLMVVDFLAMWLLPFSNTAMQSEHWFAVNTVTLLPGLVILMGVEVVWSIANHDDIRRVVYPHPFYFYVTLVSLYTLALIENGVFTMEVLFTFLWLSISIACIYAALLFSVIHQVWQHESSRTGYLLLLISSAFTVAVRLIPTFPVSCSLNILWFLPFCYVGVVFGGIVVVEQILARKHKEDELTGGAYMISLGQALIYLVVLFYFVTRLQFLGMGDASLSNANALNNNHNFELFVSGGRFIGA